MFCRHWTGLHTLAELMISLTLKVAQLPTASKAGLPDKTQIRSHAAFLLDTVSKQFYSHVFNVG